MNDICAIDLFCGAGGLTHGLVKEGIPVRAGIDLDPACKYPYEQNNDAQFIEKDVSEVKPKELSAYFEGSDIRVLAGCAPCQPFSTYSQRYGADTKGRWGLLYEFARLVKGVKPEIVTMENVPAVQNHEVFLDFVESLKKQKYFVWYGVVDSTLYGLPQTRKRLILLASKLGEIKLTAPSRTKPKTVKQTIGKLRPLRAGETDSKDPLHTAASLGELNLKRIRASKPDGTWRDWPENLVAECHKRERGKTFPGVYGRMSWDKPAPTMTTQCFGYGNGRFGHPEQDRAITLREAAMFQGFPKNYKFLKKGESANFKVLGRLIGNAVPVGLGVAVAKSIKEHLQEVGA